MIPQEEHPDINFVGLLIGPRGNTLKCEYQKFISVWLIALKLKVFLGANCGEFINFL